MSWGSPDDRPHPETRFDRVTDLREDADVHGWIPDTDVLDVVPQPREDESWPERNGH